eukprot:TRINITY_DN726_c0_g1_i4.p2 TRINITY_DN726_c0_g1~~TRINITY_DN726_c0_g1_i4.p2  ORF type:complete len:124 (-),score=19.24 TRINITY_DN726_c0_g1_i4:76-447(-)
MWALLRGHDAAAELLFSAGADLHVRDTCGDTALSLAALRPGGIPAFLLPHVNTASATRIAHEPTFGDRFEPEMLAVIASLKKEESGLQREMSQLAQAGLSFAAPPVSKGRKPTKGRARGQRRV